MTTTEVSAGPNQQVDAIVEAGRPDPHATNHVVMSAVPTEFTWDYDQDRPALEKLYKKAKGGQWDADDLPWETDVDPERIARELNSLSENDRLHQWAQEPDSALHAWSDKEWVQLGVETVNNMLSQFLHGEQGALLCTARIVETVPWIEAKYYGSTQVMDEARHVEVFARYLDTKLSDHYPINPSLASLLDDILRDERWDITYLGMQIMVEGLALAAFGGMRQVVQEPLLQQLLRQVMADEARHVAFGVLSLKEFYDGLDATEIRERQEFAYEAASRLRDRWFQTDVWERMGVDPRPVVKVMLERPSIEDEFIETLLFSKIVPNCRKLGLLDAGDGWLRQKFGELNIIQFEHWETDTEPELVAGV